MYAELIRHPLDDTCALWSGALPEGLVPDAAGFEALWALHPPERPAIHLHGRRVQIPRWQAAYGADYRFSGQVSQAQPLVPALEPFLAWAREAIEPRLSGVLLNWYDGARGHYIGPHRDSTTNLVDGTPIVTISLGEARVFRLRPWRGEGFRDFEAAPGSVFVLPWTTNAAWTHEVPHLRRFTGRRISVTLRAFEAE